MCTVTDEFWAAVSLAARRRNLAGPYLNGSRLAWAAARVLGAQDAGISLSADGTLRLPWGASSHDAAMAEQVQFTAGEGPCLFAHAEQEPVMASAGVISATWPEFAEQLHHRTPYRSVFAAPLHSAGTIDLYFTDPDGCTGVDIGAASIVTRQILVAMIDDQIVSMLEHPATLRVPAMARRAQVSVAMGMLAVALGIDHTDALAVLRAHSFATDREVDEVAADIVGGILDPDRLVG